MKKLRLKTGFNEFVSIPAEEAHKAYYLFHNPTERGVFSTGLAIRGQDIMSIEPNYHAAMGWNEGYKILPEDWGIINSNGLVKEMSDIMRLATSASMNKENLLLPLSEIKLLN